MSVVQKKISVNEDKESIVSDIELKGSSITPDDILNLQKITDNYLVNSRNDYSIEFTRFVFMN